MVSLALPIDGATALMLMLAMTTAGSLAWCALYCTTEASGERAPPAWRAFCGATAGGGLWAASVALLLYLHQSAPYVRPLALACSALLCLGGWGGAFVARGDGRDRRRRVSASALGAASLAASQMLAAIALDFAALVDGAAMATCLIVALLLTAAGFEILARPWRRLAIATTAALFSAAVLPAYAWCASRLRLDLMDRGAFHAGTMFDTAGAVLLAAWALGALALAAAHSLALTRVRLAYIAAEAARRDTLTGLLNRSGFEDALTAWAAETDARQRFAVVVVELERLGDLHVLAGHAAGDDALMQAAALLHQASSGDGNLAQGIAARLDGGAFAIALRAPNSEALIKHLQHLRVTLDCSIVAAGRAFGPEVGIGVALSPDDGADGAELVRRAYTALQHAKQSGPERLAFFECGMEDGLIERQTLEHDLAAAVSADAIEPYFQPVVRFSDGEIAGYEILARWRHHVRGPIAPEVFIPMAERAGLLPTLTLNLLRRACRAMADHPDGSRLALNLSPGLLDDPAIGFCILNVLKTCDFDPARFEVEVTETALFSDFDQARMNLATLRGRGVAVALDDFGVGYSSLMRLAELPVDVIKIDRAFVAAMIEREEACAIVASIVQLAGRLGLNVTAEGVETEAIARALKGLGCSQGQGMWLSAPQSHPPLATAAAALTERDEAPIFAKAASA